jgi:hypothetical protein
MQLIVNVFLLVTAYRCCFGLERRGAALWGGSPASR